jgi:hypothetical protein
MQRPSTIAAGLALLVASATSCGLEQSMGPGVFELQAAKGLTPDLVCAQPNLFYDVQFEVPAINTTPSDVRITSVSSNGVVTSASREGDVGTQVHTYGNLDFLPKTIPANNAAGTVGMLITMHVLCGELAPPPPGITLVGGSKNVRTILSIQTTAGTFTTRPIMNRITYSF